MPEKMTLCRACLSWWWSVDSDSFADGTPSADPVLSEDRDIWKKIRNRKMPSGSRKMPAGNPPNPHNYRESLMSSRIRFSHPLLKRSWKSSIYQDFQLLCFCAIVKVITQVITWRVGRRRKNCIHFMGRIIERRKAAISSRSGRVFKSPPNADNSWI